MIDNTDALLWQTFFAVTMFASTFVSYLLPIVLFTRRNRHIFEVRDFENEEEIHQPHHWSNQLNVATQLKKLRLQSLLSNCNCISAGVFLGVCFLNLIPYVEEEFSKLINDYDSLKNIVGSFPLGQFTVVCGLFLVLILETLLSKCFKPKPSETNRPVPILYLDDELNDSRTRLTDDHSQFEQEQLLLSAETSHHQDKCDEQSNSHDNPPEQSVNGHSHSDTNHFHIEQNDNHHGHHHHHMGAEMFVQRNDSMLTFFILMFATSIHSLFEGLALGLQTDIKYAIRLFIGIILHECLVALALGLNAVRLQQENLRMRMHIKFAFIFSLTIPVGNILGILLGYTPGHFGRFISAIFQGFAAGTFIHVTFLELIPEELLSNANDHKEAELNKLFNGNIAIDPVENQSMEGNSGVASSLKRDDETIENPNQPTSESPHESHSHGHIKMKKILLLLLGFLIMAIVPFIFSE